jgi:hypothetical protein
VLTISDSTVTKNRAKGGDGGSGATDGNDGSGLGGGVYLAGTGSTAQNVTIKNNHASTSGDDVYGSFS